MSKRWLVTVEHVDKSGERSVLYQDDDSTIYINTYKGDGKSILSVDVGKDYKKQRINRKALDSIITQLERYFETFE